MWFCPTHPNHRNLEYTPQWRPKPCPPTVGPQNPQFLRAKRKISQTVLEFKSNIQAQLNRSSLYLTNLPEKLQKADLRRSLYTLFATYGPVLDVVAVRNGKMRGQAHVAFRDVQASTQAMRALQGFDFLGKEMVCIFRVPKKTRSRLLNLTAIRKFSMPKGSQTQSPNWMAHTRCRWR